MAFLRVCTLALVTVPSVSMNLVNRKSEKCLDLFAPCLDGTDDVKCQKTPTKDLKPGTKLQLSECNGANSQSFQFLSNGRIQNPHTGLCIDIPAPCKDHFRKPCERVAVTELKGKQHVQLYTCHEDTGILSNSYGNQKWNFEKSMIKNNLSSLCLEAVAGSDASKNEVNVQTEACDGNDDQIFDLIGYSQKPKAKFVVGGKFDASISALADHHGQVQTMPVLGALGAAALAITRHARHDGTQADEEALIAE